MINILQANMQRSRIADLLLDQLARELEPDLLLISEQYKNRDPLSWYADELGTAAIWVPDPVRVPVSEYGCGRGFVWVRHKGITFISVYLTPNEPIAHFLEKLHSLEDLVMNATGGVVMGGDFNARALEWGMPSPDARGNYIMEMTSRTGLLVLNVGRTPTFRRPGCSGSIPDISFATEQIVPLVEGWRVIEDYTGSDHQYVVFAVSERRERRGAPHRVPSRWNVARLNEAEFEEVVCGEVQALVGAGLSGGVRARTLVDSTMGLITEACDTSMPRKRPRHGKRPVYWWTPEIAELRRECLRLRRLAQRARERAEANLRAADHRAKKRQLRRAINSSKTRCWEALRREIDTDPWGLGYKLVTQKLGALKSTSPMDAGTMDHIVNALFPAHPARAVRAYDGNDAPPFTMAELEEAVLSLKAGKAPGPDGVPGEVLRLVLRLNPDLLLRMYNACLSAGIFPKCWKTARLVLISKGKGDPEQPSSYRPLCMLDTAGKVLEKLLKPRLLSAIQAAGDLSPKQFGFRSRRSTADAISEVAAAVRRAEDCNHFSRRIVLLVTLDVRNAFNSARWCDMLQALESDFHVPGYLLRIISDYLDDRTLLYETTEGQRSMVVTGGAAQGSVLGPDLWNVLYDGLLRLSMPEESMLVGYADDVALLIAARDVELAQLKLNQAMRSIHAWMEGHGLSLALNKTEIVVLTKRRINITLPMRVNDVDVVTKPVVKYLGIMVDSKLNFFEQIRETADRAARGVMALARLMANVGGPRSSRRRLLMSAVQSVLLYGAEIWAHALDKEMYRIRLGRVQRLAALRVASAYRTVSEPAILVIAGVIPIALLARERQAIFRRKAEANTETVKAEERARTLQKWQEEWDGEMRGRWTKRLIGQVAPWLERRKGEVDYYLTQFLTGHGYFRAYLFRMGKVGSAECIYCPGMHDDAEHTFFICDRWARERQELVQEAGLFSPDTVVGRMLEDKAVWDRFSHYAQIILRRKKVDLDLVDDQHSG